MLTIPKQLWYLSFADPELPPGTRFLGATVVDGFDIIDAAANARLLGINPGGEVLGVPTPFKPEDPLVSFMYHKLVSRETIEKYSGPTVTVGEIKDAGCIR